MTDTTKSLLVIGVVGVGAYFVVKTVATSTVKKTATGSATNAGLTGLLSSAIGLGTGLFKSSPPQSPVVPSSAYASGTTDTGSGEAAANSLSDQDILTNSDDQNFADSAGFGDAFDFLGGE